MSGSGGVGKTRLALRVAAEELAAFPGGVWFIELAPLIDPALIPNTIASALGVREEANRPILATLSEHLRAQSTLIVLDNCEHLIDAAARVCETLLRAAPFVKIIVTSRESLGIAGEHAHQVPSLDLPLPGSAQSGLERAASVQLFRERAASAKSDFVLTAANAAAVAHICRRLDGIPLAIELAAARVKALPAEKIAERLDDCFRLLTGGSRTALPRQQTLRGMIDWSHGLLPEGEQVLLRRLAVFAGGWTLEAGEEVASDTVQETPAEATLRPQRLTLRQGDVLTLLSRLVDKSLVVLDEEHPEPRYRMLETIRQYAREKLLESDEGESLRSHHFDFYTRLAEAFSSAVGGPDDARWLDRLELERDNLRAAIEWAMEKHEAQSGMRLTAALHWFWQQRYTNEGQNFLQLLLLMPEAARRSRERARALWSQGYLAARHGNPTAASALLAEALSIARAEGDRRTTAYALDALGVAALRRNDMSAAQAFLAEALQIFQAGNDQWRVGAVLYNLGDVARSQGDIDRAQALYEESVATLKRIGEQFDLGVPLRRLGQLAVARGDFARAGKFIAESLTLNVDIGDRGGIATCLAAAAGLHAARGRLLDAVRLYGAAEALLSALRMGMNAFNQNEAERGLTALRAQLEPAAFDAAFAAGRALPLEQAVELALQRQSIE